MNDKPRAAGRNWWIVLPVIALLTSSCPLAAQTSPNLLLQSGFEPSRGIPADLAPWSEQNFPAGCVCGVDNTVAHSGSASYKMTLPDTVPVSWYSLGQPIAVLRKGVTYTISAYIRTQGVHDGAGAYISLNFFKGTDRIGYQDSKDYATGNSEWRRVTATVAVPDGASEMRALLVLHGHGTAWFDDVQVEAGPVASAYSPSASDAAMAAAYEAEHAAVTGWLTALPPRAPGQARIALLQEQFPAGPGSPSQVSVLAAALKGAGYQPVSITAEQAANSAFLDPSIFDLLIVPSGDAYPSAAHHALVDYLRRGGCLLTTGGYAFDRPLVRFQGKWYRPEDLPAGSEPATPVFEAGTRGWTRASNRLDSPQIDADPGPHGEAGVKVSTDRLDMWDTSISPNVAGKLPAGWSITRFWAKADGNTPALSVEWHEIDGSRWKKVVHLAPGWHEYVLFPSDFSYWPDNNSVGRGSSGDRFNPANAKCMQVGVSADIAATELPTAVWFAGVRVQADSAGPLRGVTPRINTRYATIRDAMWPDATQLPVFDAGYPLDHVSTTRPSSGQDIISDFELNEPLSGYSAVTMLGTSGHGFYPSRCRWVPLLSCYDSYGHPRGQAGAIIHHFKGTFAGSSWAIFGVGNRDIFSAGSPALRRVLLPTVSCLLRHLYVHDTTTNYACYRSGETVLLRTSVSNFGKASVRATVRFVIFPQGESDSVAAPSREITVTPGATVSVEVPYKPASFASDYYTISAQLETGNVVRDHEDNAFVVWNPAVLASGPKLGRVGTHFTLNGVSALLFGCQSFWGQVDNLTARSPAAFERDFEQMRSYGLRWSRAFLPFKTEEDKRICDAVVQLAQKNGIVLYDAINLNNTADPDALQQEAATIREATQRYKDVPGFAFDICNEPEFHSDDPALKKLAQSPVTDGAWSAPGPVAYWRAMADAQSRWATTNIQAIHSVDPQRMGSVGWSQGWAGGKSMKDPILASLNLDFTDRHYYGNLDNFPSEFEDLDLRCLGKPHILGECGAVDHPTYKAMDPWGNGADDASYDHRFLYLTHMEVGLGGTVMSSWHFRDPMEGIFPFGVVHQDNVPKPTALAYRATVLALSRLTPVTTVPPVVLLMPDAGRMGGQRAKVISAVHRAANLLIASRVDFSELPDSALATLPVGVRAVVYPVPLDPSSDVLAHLAAFADNGGAVYISGDLSYDSERKPTERDRLVRLCGVVWKADRCTPGPDGWPLNVSKLQPIATDVAAGSGLATWDSRAAIDVSLAGAQALATANGMPVATRMLRGKGSVWFTPDPIETSPVLLPAHIALYRAFLASSGVAPLKVTPDSPDVNIFHVPCKDADAWVFYNGGPAGQVSSGGFTLQLDKGGTGLVIVGHDGAVRAVEAQGAVIRGKSTLANFEGHGFLVALDDKDIAESRDLLALPLAPGAITLARSQPAGRANVVDWRNGAWSPIGHVATALQGGRLKISVAPEQSREVIRIAEADR